MVRSDAELVDGANELARQFYRAMGYVVRKGYRFDNKTHPQEVVCWKMAVMAYDHIDGSDIESALAEVEEA